MALGNFVCSKGLLLVLLFPFEITWHSANELPCVLALTMKVYMFMWCSCDGRRDTAAQSLIGCNTVRFVDVSTV